MATFDIVVHSSFLIPLDPGDWPATPPPSTDPPPEGETYSFTEHDIDFVTQDWDFMNPDD